MTATGIAAGIPSDTDQRRQLRRAVVASAIGTTIECYDFFIYGIVTGLGFAKLYFPQSDPLAGTFQAYAVFFVGFIARPVGAAIFGHYGNLPRSSPAARCRSSPRRCSPSSNRAMRSPSTSSSSAALSSALSPPRCSPTTPTGTSRRNRQIPLQQPVDREQGHEGHAEPLEEADVRLAPAAEFALIGALNPPRAVTQYFRQFRRRRFANILRAA